MSSSFLPHNVQRITNSAAATEDAVVMVKLTDEMFAALEQCQKNGKKIRIRVDEHSGTIEIGDGHASSATNNTFRFQKQVLSDSTDTLIQTGSGVRNVGTYRTKYQIQATDKSFEETRKRAERRAEVEKSRGTKEMKKNVASSASSRLLSSSSSTPRNLGSSLRASPSSSSSLAASTSKATPTGAGGNPPADTTKSDQSNMLRHELMKKSLKKRIIHLIATQKYRNWTEVMQKLQADGIPDEKAMSPGRVEDLCRDVAEHTPTSIYLTLRAGSWSEVDPRWVNFNQDEKALVRKLMAAAQQQKSSTDSSSFAPTRKKGMERMTASSRREASAAAGPPAAPPVVVVAPPPPPPPPVVAPPPPATPQMDEMNNSGSKKRKAHQPAQPAAAAPTSAEKRARREEEMAPPPPPAAPHHHHHQQHQQHHHHHAVPTVPPVGGLGGGGGGSTASSRLSSPASSLSSPTQPSCDWEKQFGEIKTMPEAEHYFAMFHKEYPIYMEYYRKLADVSREFRQLEHRLAQAMARRKSGGSKEMTKEVAEVEKHIQNRYMFFEKDPEFLRARQKHTDLRSKLAVLKTRISAWEQAHQRQTSV